MRLLDLQPLVRLRDEFRQSMRRLLADLCRELSADHADLARECRLPIDLFDSLRSSFAIEAYSNWKMIGWIEALNDLVYFLDVLTQLRLDRDRADFAAQLFDECQEKFFEHGYFDDLFPTGKPHAGGLEKRLFALCCRLAQELIQESLWFDPAVPVTWCRQRKMMRWEVCGNLKENFEKAELAGMLSVDITGGWCKAPSDVGRALRRSSGLVEFRVEPTGVTMKTGKVVSSIWSRCGEKGQWEWAYHPPVFAIYRDHETVTVGPTLVYGKDRQPRTVQSTDQRSVDRIARAWQTIQLAWPEGHEVVALLTSRIVPLQAKGVVSFSYRHRPGLSFINCFDRGNLDLIDDLIHENSHHHLNLLLRKYVMYRGDHNQQIFYSPWRRSLRPLRGILHATFTFTMGALLFERLSLWGSGLRGAVRWEKAGLTQRDLQRAHFRCLEEIESVRHSLQDLHYADHHLGWLTGSGRRLVEQLAEAIDQVEHESKRFRDEVERSRFGSALRKHIKELRQARQTYGPVRLSKI
ncbi:MAG: HEXXH motif-containing putative peptide modification protein [Nitrospira sp.]|nr:HEXXH motif-containing putative peptide modification protein [Nitrospira sp.]MDH5346900.1 HEXXH motif-containing putative peptide modification protein [Nitrospira sp.]